MLGLNIFRLIADLFTFILQPFKWLRLEVAKGDLGWWTSNAVNWVFILILIVLFGYWMSQSLGFRKNGTEDKA
ncbi:hypothetical protein J2Q11_00720 [Tenacibaculum finnmarkense genomovar finnmarkense]|uniref:Uracil phosphoribosyltransferase n=1 Tax=Tenacibaculum finnmarkense genomovar finnmarkense TaxID=1458503 RepID=A0AAP1RCL4_9FLAO|nr:hypothetical protein [Tenacibaculum finnmarkense]MBE7651781.1 hypothetical protein [Tenacibaculum finnmarkense genomovar finnmarkense]MBE7659414.1 hypothetical protein [Tenacibaculum finnmarkense genomovar finnmarkense]MBE7692140.1 hypothetical protein [Tenacibaculum finnmarkense genomovar finnmarkense]MBE7693869.1 hypothetical protein [Tenacibaculum finnmarkense genomovar finnmarkense]MCD8402345.1 hypothetical protein [Tenacibaculum finnmarkense genomovar finnmarkense]